MATKQPHAPKFRRHSSGQAYVEIEGRRTYLGKHDSPKTVARYHRLVAEWSAGSMAPPPAEQVTIDEVVDAFLTWATKYYGKSESRSKPESDCFKAAIRPLLRLYGDTLAVEFGPRRLRVVRDAMIAAGWSRAHVNRQIGRLRFIFKWATSEEIVPVTVFQTLGTVPGLKRGRTEAVELEPIRPVPIEHVEAIKPHVSAIVWAIIQVQRYTACRPGEAVRMRPLDFDCSGEVWVCTLDKHKTAHHGRERHIYFGPRAQEIVGPYMIGRAVDAPLFSAAEAIKQKGEAAPTHRRPDQSETERATDRMIGNAYTVNSYRRAIHRACKKAGVPQWSPNRLRHTAATLIRKSHGLEACQLMLGHAKADVSQLYAERDEGKAIEVASKVG